MSTSVQSDRSGTGVALRMNDISKSFSHLLREGEDTSHLTLSQMLTLTMQPFGQQEEQSLQWTG